MDNSYGELKAAALKNLEAVKSVAGRMQDRRPPLKRIIPFQSKRNSKVM